MEISQLDGNTLVDATFHEYINTVGAVIFSFDNSFSPSALWGGSWTRIMDRFIVGAGGTYQPNATGGSLSHQHSYGVKYSPYYGALVGSDATAIQCRNYISGSYSNSTIVDRGNVTANAGLEESMGQADVTTYLSEALTSADSSIPPYIGCFIWRKIA